MTDSAMVSTLTGRQAADQPEVVRAAVLAGPGVLDEQLADRLWPVLIDPGLIERARVESGHVDGRQRVLIGAVTVMIVLGLCLFRRESVGVVTARVTEGIPRVRIEGVPSGPAVSKARARVPAAVQEQVFVAAAADAPAAGAESYASDLVGDRDRRHGVRPGEHSRDAGAVRHAAEGPVPAHPLNARQNVPATSPTR